MGGGVTWMVSGNTTRVSTVISQRSELGWMLPPHRTDRLGSVARLTQNRMAGSAGLDTPPRLGKLKNTRGKGWNGWWQTSRGRMQSPFPRVSVKAALARCSQRSPYTPRTLLSSAYFKTLTLEQDICLDPSNLTIRHGLLPRPCTMATGIGMWSVPTARRRGPCGSPIPPTSRGEALPTRTVSSGCRSRKQQRYRLLEPASRSGGAGSAKTTHAERGGREYEAVHRDAPEVLGEGRGVPTVQACGQPLERSIRVIASKNWNTREEVLVLTVEFLYTASRVPAFNSRSQNMRRPWVLGSDDWLLEEDRGALRAVPSDDRRSLSYCCSGPPPSDDERYTRIAP